MSLKFIYKFTASRTQEVEKTEVEKRGEEEVKVVKKVKEQVPYNFAILKPGRGLKEEAEIFHAGLMNEYVIVRGLMTRQQLIKRYANDGGSMSEPEKLRYADLLSIVLKEEERLERIQINLDSLNEEEKGNKIQESTRILVAARSELHDIISSQNSLYQHTAETKAEEKTIFWWVLKLAYVEKDGNYAPFFGPGSITDRMAKYDEYEDADNFFEVEMIKKFIWLVGMWYSGNITDQQSFEQVSEQFKLDSSDRSNPDPVTVSTKEIEPAKA